MSILTYHYDEHSKKSFFKKLIKYMSSGPIIVILNFEKLKIKK